MGIHDGHRERLRSRFLEHGLDNFNELNALELFLFYSIPRQDTNALAHVLLDHFGSLSAVFEASEQELLAIPGVGTTTASLILLVPQITKKCEISKIERKKPIMNSEDAASYLMPRFMYEMDEVVLMLCLDSQRRVICCTEIGRGVVNSVETSLRRIVEIALRNKTAFVIISHNHPDGIALPSKEDDSVTSQISTALSMVAIPLVDHIIVAEDDYVSYSDSGMLHPCRM